jgi:hypothetical protein
VQVALNMSLLLLPTWRTWRPGDHSKAMLTRQKGYVLVGAYAFAARRRPRRIPSVSLASTLHPVTVSRLHRHTYLLHTSPVRSYVMVAILMWPILVNNQN